MTRGFSNWKDATRSFKNHESSVAHRKAVDVMISIPTATRDVGEMLSSE